MLRSISFRGLRAFCLASHYLSFKDAADHLCLTGSAVSHQISDLEEELGCNLFRRLTRSIERTEKGEQLYTQLIPHMQGIEQAVLTAKSQKVRTPLLVQVPEFFASELLMPLMSSFSDKHEDVDLRIESMHATDEINNSADLNIILSRKIPAGRDVEKLFPIRYIPACSQELFQQYQDSGVSGPGAIQDATILLHKARPNAWMQWAQHTGTADIAPRQIIYVDTMFALVRAAERSAGIALVPMPVSKAWFDSGALVPLGNSELVTEDYYWMRTNQLPGKREAASKFAEWVVTHLQRYGVAMDEPNSFVA